MGIEYKILCDPAAVSRLDELIRHQQFFESFDVEHRLYKLRFPGQGKPQDIPDAYVAVEADGIFFCDNLTTKDSASRILRALIDHALAYSQQITIHEP